MYFLRESINSVININSFKYYIYYDNLINNILDFQIYTNYKKIKIVIIRSNQKNLLLNIFFK